MNYINRGNLIPVPCHQKWEDMGKEEIMKEGHTARMCDECLHHIHDISDMSAKQILDLKTDLSLKGQKLCGMVRQSIQPSQTSINKLQRFSLVCMTAIAPVALVACGGTPNFDPNLDPNHEVNQPYRVTGYQNHNLPSMSNPAALPPLVAGIVVPPSIAGIVTPPRINQ